MLRLPAGGAVADSDVLHPAALHHTAQGDDGLLLLPLAVGGVHHGGVQHLAGPVHHGHLAAHAIAGVQAHGHLPLHGRLHQKGPQIQGELADGPLAGQLRQGRALLPLQGGEDQPLIGVLRRLHHEIRGRTAQADRRPPHRLHGRHRVELQAHLQEFLLLAPVDGQDLIALELGNGLGEVVVHGVHGVLLRGGLGAQPAVFPQQTAQGLAELRVVADPLRDDVGGPRQGRLHAVHPQFWVDIIHRRRFRPGSVLGLGKEQLRQGLQTLLPGDGGPGAALGPIGQIQVLQLRQGGGGLDGGPELRRQLALAVDALEDGLPALLQTPQVLQAGLQGPQGAVVHGAVELLAVAGDEGDGVPLVDELNDVFNVLGAPVQFPGQSCDDVHSSSLICVCFGFPAQRPRAVLPGCFSCFLDAYLFISRIM